MPRPRAELRGCLRYRGCGPGPRLSLLHVRLSAAAARALSGCGRRQGAPGPVIAFQGSQGSLTLPGGPGDPPQVFAFSLSHCSWNEPWGSFECARLAVPRLGQSWLDTLGSIREKITVCAWEGTCPRLQERVAPAKEPCGRAALEPDAAALGYGKGVTALEAVGVTSLPGKGPARRVRVPTTASPGASSQRLVQPRAPRPRHKHQLLRRPEGTAAAGPGGARRLAEVREPAAAAAGVRILPCSLQAAELDPAACCYPVVETPARREQYWPGKAALEPTALLQSRNQDCAPSAPSFLVPLQQALEHSSPQAPGQNLPGVKRLALLDFSDPRANKRCQVPASGPGWREQHQSCLQTLVTRQPGARGQQGAGPLPPSSHPAQPGSPENQEEAGEDWEESVPRPVQHLCAPGDARPQASGSSLAEIPDYLSRTYQPICSAEQRRAYEAAFGADYAEYRCLHGRVGSASRRFLQLGARMKRLKRGTEERKALEATILQEYRHFKETYPSYQQEKQRCEYLHQKLSHIKNLILQFEGSGSS